MYDDGDGIITNDAEAARWYSKAASKGFARAQYKLGELYRSGDGVKKNGVKAFKLYHLAAVQENLDAQFALAWMYMSGTGTTKDLSLAHMWWNIAHSNGDEKAGPVRDALEKEMTAAEISRAKKKSKLCMKSKYQRCS